MDHGNAKEVNIEKFMFDIAYGEYLEKSYPDIYSEGVKLAMEKYHCTAKSFCAFFYAIGFVKGRLKDVLQTKHKRLH